MADQNDIDNAVDTAFMQISPARLREKIENDPDLEVEAGTLHPEAPRVADPVFISSTCQGETCMCGSPAVRKIGEEIPYDDPNPHRHNFTAYVCAEHYAMLLGPTAARSVGIAAPFPEDNPDAPLFTNEQLETAKALRGVLRSVLETGICEGRNNYVGDEHGGPDIDEHLATFVIAALQNHSVMEDARLLHLAMTAHAFKTQTERLLNADRVLLDQLADMAHYTCDKFEPWIGKTAEQDHALAELGRLVGVVRAKRAARTVKPQT